jgi:hypothetical protein
MWHVGIDLHRQTVVVAAVNDAGEVRATERIECSDAAVITKAFEALRPFRGASRPRAHTGGSTRCSRP